MSVAVIILYYYQINDFRYLELLSYFFTLALSLFSNGPTSRNIKQYWPHWPFLYYSRIIRLDELGQKICSSPGYASQV